MPASEKTSYNMKRLHRVFAVSSVALLAVTVWAVFDDHGRPWKRHQRDFQHVERSQVAWQLMAATDSPDFDSLQQEKLEEELRQLNPTWFSGSFPWLGAKWLDLPLLDAFNSPVKIDQVWLPDLTQDYHHEQVDRFDRCVTCHVATDRTRPGSAAQPLFSTRRTVTLRLPTPPEPPSEPAESQVAPADGTEAAGQDRLAQVYGFSIVGRGMMPDDGVSVRQVLPEGLASVAMVVERVAVAPEPQPASDDEPTSLTGLDLRHQIAAGTLFEHTPAAIGLEVGDVLLAVNGEDIQTPADVERLLLDEVAWGQPVELLVKRGLPQPLASHPRLDLFVSSLSPHPLQDFGCTICHAGQGSATTFDWASHTANDLSTEDRWREEFGWRRNSHWEWPMLPVRFAESGCLKCHHEVVDLQANHRFPEAPAPKVAAGYELVRRHGCFGCHEMNGYDVEGRRVGPDLRLEPNDYAVGLALRSDPGFEELDAGLRADIDRLTQFPADAQLADRVRRALLADARSEEPLLSPQTHQLAEPLRHAATPGTLRKVGPSLRYVAAKYDESLLRSWIRNPRDYQADSRMPRFFGLWSHLTGTGLGDARRNEPVEILGIATYLTGGSQSFEMLAPPPAEDDAALAEAVARGRLAFELSGCLACHRHSDFPNATSDQGPDLFRLAGRLSPETGRAWLYTWLRDPQRYHLRTTMPNLRLDRKVDEDGTATDTAADITDYLLSGKPGPDAAPLTQPSSDEIDDLVRRNLEAAFSGADAGRYAEEGIPLDVARGLIGPEQELVAPITDEKKLRYVGRKAIAVRGCSGCHDIPGAEAAKPIGPALADWGRKKEELLDCGRVVEYLESREVDSPDNESAEDTPEKASGGNGETGQANEAAAAASPDPYFVRAVQCGSRIGFLAQKLREPRSFDYLTKKEKYYARLQMPQFPFDSQQREELMTFILGLVAQPPPEQFVYRPSDTDLAVARGRQLLEQYNCAGCHVLRPQQWEIAFRSGEIPSQPDKPTFPFVKPSPGEAEIAASATPGADGLLHATVTGMPSIFDADGLPFALSEDEEPLEDDEDYETDSLFYLFDLWEPAVLDGQAYRPGVIPLMLTADMIRQQHPAEGGELGRLLFSRALTHVRQTDPAAKGSEAWAWLPPPLMGEGRKVQSPWLYEYLLDPTTIRPAAIMKMPRFPLSPPEAERLARYFALVDGADYPYFVVARQGETYLDAAREAYDERLAQLTADTGSTVEGDHFDDALRIVLGSDYCVKCHQVGDFSPGGSRFVTAPNLANVCRRLRPNYLRQWVADPTIAQPYTTMPTLIPYTEGADHEGGVPQDLYHGTSTEQLDAVVDLLLNFDRYSARKNPQIEALKRKGNDQATGDAAKSDNDAAP